MYKVFLADDEVWITIDIKKMIEKTGAPFQVIGEANNGVVALEEVLNKKPDVLITDIRMPGLNGLDLMERLKEANSDTKVILVSGYAEFEYAQKALKMGAIDYLLKPVELDKLKDALSRLEKMFREDGRECDALEPENVNISMIQSIIKELQENFTKNITLTELAEQYNVSAGYLSILLKDELGLSFTEYLASKRVQKAKELLADKNLSIQLIAEKVGYRDYFYFVKVFKKVVGMSPSKYRKTL